AADFGWGVEAAGNVEMAAAPAEGRRIGDPSLGRKAKAHGLEPGAALHLGERDQSVEEPGPACARDARPLGVPGEFVGLAAAAAPHEAEADGIAAFVFPAREPLAGEKRLR